MGRLPEPDISNRPQTIVRRVGQRLKELPRVPIRVLELDIPLAPRRVDRTSTDHAAQRSTPPRRLVYIVYLDPDDDPEPARPRLRVTFPRAVRKRDAHQRVNEQLQRASAEDCHHRDTARTGNHAHRQETETLVQRRGGANVIDS
jgi:hypothetical protein